MNITWTAYPDANVTGFYDALVYYNTVTSDTFVSLMLIGIYMVLIMVFGRFGMKKSFMVSSFAMFVMSAALRMAGLVGDPIILLFGICSAIGMLMTVE